MNLRGLPPIIGMALLVMSARESAAQQLPPAGQAPRTEAERRAVLDDSLNRPVEEVAQIFSEMLRQNQTANAPVLTPATDPHVIEFREAVPKFLDAIRPFQSTVSSGGDPDKYAKVIEKQTDVFLRYTKWMGSKAQRPNTSDLSKLKPDIRSGEMIVSLTKVLTTLIPVLQDDKNLTTSIPNMETIEAFEAETFRLKWLSSHLP